MEHVAETGRAGPMEVGHTRLKKEEIMTMNITEGTLTPAYGRDYGSKAAAVGDFRRGLEFILNMPDRRPVYCSIRDFEPEDMVKIRYNRGRDVSFYRVTPADFK